VTNAKKPDLDLSNVVTASAAKQIAENIRSAILQGKLKVGVRLPSEASWLRNSTLAPDDTRSF